MVQDRGQIDNNLNCVHDTLLYTGLYAGLYSRKKTVPEVER